MSRSPIEYMQEALTARFAIEFVGKGLAGKVYNHVPEATAMPYLFMGPWSLTATEVKGASGSPYTVTGTLHVYSNTTGSEQCQQLSNDVVEAVTTANLNLSAVSFENFMISLQSIDISPESNSAEVRWHGTIVFQWRVQDVT
jgi:hypothetical protein